MNRSVVQRIAVFALIVLGTAIALGKFHRDACQPVLEEGPSVSRVDLGAPFVARVASGPKGLWAIRWLAQGKGRQSDVVELDPVTGKIVGSPIALPAFGVALDVGNDAIWVVSNTSTKTPRGTLLRIDPRSHRTVSELALGRGATSVSAGEGGVWVTSDAGTVVRVDAKGRRVVTTVPVGGRPDLVLARAGSVWVGMGQSFFRIDPAAGRQTGGADGTLVNVGPDAVWVVGSGAPNGRLLRIDPATLRPVGPALGLDIIPATVGVAGREVWVGKYFSSCDPRNRGRRGTSRISVGWFRVDPATLKPLSGPVDVGPNPRTPVFAAGAFWIGPETGNAVIRVDLATANKVRPPAQVPVLRR